MIPPRARLLLALTVLLCASSFTSALAQQNTDTQVLNATVTNSKNRVILGLKPEHFIVKADDIERKIFSCEVDKSPMNVGILFDISSSIGSPGEPRTVEIHQRVATGISRFLELSNPDNDYFLAPFDGRVSFSKTWTGSNTSLVDKLVAPKATGTALYDAIYQGLEHVQKGRHTRHVLLLITDGQDNNSTKAFKEVIEAMKRSDVTVFALGLVSSPDQGSALGMESQGVLDELTEVSGGRALILPRSAKPEALKVAFENLANELQSQYRLSIETEKTSTPQKWRKLKVQVRYVDDAGRKQEVRVRARRGFYR